MLKVLSLPEGEGALEFAGRWSRTLARMSEGLELRVANRLWGNRTLPFRSTFLQSVERQQGAGMETLDFTHPERARQRVNSWIADQTKGRIPDLLPAGIITTNTRLVLTNAVYFLGKWALSFDTAGTTTGNFACVDGSLCEVRMMNRRFETLPYMEDSRLQAIRLDYAGGTHSMVVMLPRRPDELKSHELISEPVFSHVIRTLKMERNVAVCLPRFEVQSRLSLNTLLRLMGMARAFSEQAEFGRMCTSPLCISDVVHQTWAKVGELGTEAAAATAVLMAPPTCCIDSSEPKVFRADRPFLFYIVENATDGILFAGKVMQPAPGE